MGECTSKQAIAKRQNQKQKDQNNTQKSIAQSASTQKTAQCTAKYDEKIISKRQDRILDDETKETELRKKLKLIRNGKYEEAGIKPSNAYFEMVKLQKQIELYEKKIGKSKMEISKFQSRKAINA